MSLPDMPSDGDAPLEIQISTEASEDKIPGKRRIRVNKEKLARAWGDVGGAVATYTKKCRGANKKVSAIINSIIVNL